MAFSVLFFRLIQAGDPSSLEVITGVPLSQYCSPHSVDTGSQARWSRSYLTEGLS